MQNYLDTEKVSYKKLAKWDIEKEARYQAMTVYDYNFHIWALNRHHNDGNRKDSDSL